MAEDANTGVAIRVEGLSHSYPSPDGIVAVLSDLNLEVRAGGYLAVTAPSGAGKSTLLAVLGGLESLQGGAVRVGETDLAGLKGDALAAYRQATVGFVFQHFGLLETLTAIENVELASALSGLGARDRRARAHEMLGAVGLSHRVKHRALQLSGGERQRVAIARAMVNRPRLVLADEPTGNLDSEAATMVIGLLERLRNETGFTLVIVTHDKTLSRRGEQHLALKAVVA